MVSNSEFMDRMGSRYRKDGDHYAMSLTAATIIDGYRMGNMCRTVNHSCQPNCEMQKWFVYFQFVYLLGFNEVFYCDAMNIRYL